MMSALVALAFSSCSKVAPLQERALDSDSSTMVLNEKIGSTTQTENNGSGGITDPDHDEEHDKDDKSVSSTN